MRRKKTAKELHICNFVGSAKRRAKRDGVPFNITGEYLLTIAPDECPVFHTPFEWGLSGLGRGHAKPNGPTLDRIEPHLGYVEGNVAFISYRANRLKDDGTMQEHYDIADWIWNHLYAKPNSTPPVPKRTNLKGIDNSKPGPIPTTRLRQNNDDTDYHCGAIYRVDIDNSPQESSRDSVGRRSEEVVSSKTLESKQDNGEPIRPYVWP
jgi:hypothetical protein